MLRTATALPSLILAFLLSTLASAQVTFIDVTGSAGTGLGETTTRGIAWADFNNDGYPDLYVPTSGSSPNKLYRNNGDGTFTEVAAAVGLNDLTNTTTCTWADFDNDGDLDLLTTAQGAGAKLWRNNLLPGNDTTFADITATAGILLTNAQMPTWADYNRDGFVDLYSPVSSTSSPDALYRNNHDATFTNMVDSAGVNHMISGISEQATMWTDYNKDGHPDLFIGSLTGQSFFHRNNGNGTFTEIASTMGFQGPARGAQWVDYNNDGLWDLSIAGYSGSTTVPVKLFKNNGDGTFTDVAVTAGMADPVISWGVSWADYDNNGYEDLFVNVFGQSTSCILYKNNGNGTFTNATSQAGLTGLTALSAVWGDYDSDGDMDLYTAGTGSTGNHLYKNGGDSTKKWLEIKLVGTRSNRSGVGAQIAIKAGSLRMLREISTGVGYRSQNSMTAHFGLNMNTSADSVVVRWPRGGQSVLTNVPANTLLTITEPSTPPLPAISVTPDTITLIGQHLFRDTLHVRNIGQAPLVVDTIYPGPRFHPPVAGMFHAVPDSFVVQPGNSRAVLVYLDIPVSPLVYMFNDSLYVHSDDPVHPVVIVSFRGDFPSDVEADKSVPTEAALHQNYPNPFNPRTIIRFAVAQPEYVKIAVFDDLGRMVRVLVEGVCSPGEHETLFETSALSSGVYYYRMTTRTRTDTRKLVLIR